MQLMTEVQRVRMLALAKAHQKRDEYIAGRYEFENGGACSIGCTILDAKKLKIIPDVTSNSDHASVGELLGHGQIMARLQDYIFEGLSQSKNKKAAREFTPKIIAAIKTGADYSLAWPKFAVWLMREELPKTTKNEKSLAAINGVAKLYEEWAGTGVKPERSRFEAAASAAYRAAYRAASAAYRAASAAYKAASAAYRAASAAYGDASAAYGASGAYGDASGAYGDASAAYRAASAAYKAASAAYRAASAAYGDASAAYGASGAYGDASAAYGASGASAGFKFWKRASTKFIEILEAA